MRHERHTYMHASPAEAGAQLRAGRDWAPAFAGEAYLFEATPSARALARAREAIGVKFRLHGRDSRGLDCVGLAAWAWEVAVPTGYALRSGPQGRIEAELAAMGFVPGNAPGAVVLVAPGPGQLHLGIATGAGILGGVIHADATARRVVERAAPLPWAVLGSWMREA